jgi:uncharacterized protein YycO
MISYRTHELDLREGDVILFHTPFEPLKNPVSFVSLGVRFFTQCDYNHCAIITSMEEKLHLVEAKAEGVVAHPVEEVLDREKDRIMVLRRKEVPGDVSQKANSRVGAPYDYMSLLVYQPIYRTPKLLFGRYGKWYGPTGDKAEWAEVCSEVVAYAHGLDQFWLVSGAEILQNQIFTPVFTEPLP